MSTVAIIGAGEVGGAAAQALAARDRIARVLLIDAAGQVAAGKALDIQQSGPIDRFDCRLAGTSDLSAAIGAAVCIVADRFGAPSVEWRVEDGLAMLERVLPYTSAAPLIFAGATQAELMRYVRVPREQVVGTAAEAHASAVRAIVALEARGSPADVMLSVLGTPEGGFIVPWSEASLGGYALERVLSPVQMARIAARAERLWPPGAYTLGVAAARVAEAIVTSSRRSFSVLTRLQGEFGVRNRIGAVPVGLCPAGIAYVRVPSLSTRERVQVESALSAGR